MVFTEVPSSYNHLVYEKRVVDTSFADQVRTQLADRVLGYWLFGAGE